MHNVDWVIICTGTGFVQFDEFCGIVQKKMQNDEDEREHREMFRILDKEKRGEVNTNELRSHCLNEYYIDTLYEYYIDTLYEYFIDTL